MAILFIYMNVKINSPLILTLKRNYLYIYVNPFMIAWFDHSRTR